MASAPALQKPGIPDDVQEQLPRRICRLNVDSLNDDDTQDLVEQILHRGEQLEGERCERERAERDVAKQARLQKLHASCNHPYKKAKVIVGSTNRNGNVICTSAQFCHLVGATPMGRKQKLQEVEKTIGETIFDGEARFGRWKVNMKLWLAHARWKATRGKPFQISSTAYNKKYGLGSECRARAWPGHFECAIHEDDMEQRTLTVARYEPCAQSGGIHVSTLQGTLVYSLPRGGDPHYLNNVIQDLRKTCVLSDAEFEVSLLSSAGNVVPSDQPVPSGYYTMVVKDALAESRLKSIQGAPLASWVRSLPGCSHFCLDMAYLDKSAFVEARIELLEKEEIVFSDHESVDTIPY